MGNVYFLNAGGVSVPRRCEAGGICGWFRLAALSQPRDCPDPTQRSSYAGKRSRPSRHPAWAELVSNFQMGRLGGVVLSSWTIAAGWNVQSRQRGLASRKMPVTKRALVTSSEIRVWEHARSHSQNTQCAGQTCCWRESAMEHCSCVAKLGWYKPLQTSAGKPFLLPWLFREGACGQFYGILMLLR